MRLFITATLALLVCSVTGVATAGNASLCARGGWAQAQSSTGSSFTSMTECAKAREVYRPTLTISPTTVVANERFTLTATGFHPNAHSTIDFAITGQAPYATYVPYYPTDADGNFWIPFGGFPDCGSAPPSYDLTLTFTDSYGVHASAQMTLC